MKTVAATIITHGRVAEWMTAMAMLGFALVLAMPGDTFQSSPGWDVFAHSGLGEPFVALVLGVIAVCRIGALYINGRWKRTPGLRMFGAAAGAAVFGWLSMSFLWPYVVGTTSTLSTAFTTYAVLMVADVIAAYRAGADVGRASSDD